MRVLLLIVNENDKYYCSGGQQRRTSLATAFVHDPDLLILDEPVIYCYCCYLY